MKIDLHFHSNASDGTRDVAKIKEIILNLKVDIVSLTDHDTIDNVMPLINALETSNVKVIPGIELSTLHKGNNIHVLGYFRGNKYLSQEFKEILNDFKVKRIKRAHDMVALLKKHYGLEIDLDKLNLKEGVSLGRPHMASLIREKYNLTMDEIFRRYLGNDSLAYIPSSNMTSKEGIDLIKRFDGIPILAHPVEYRKIELEELLDELNFLGVECYYPTQDKKLTKKYVEICKKRNLLVTVGSDDHGIIDDYKHGIIGSTRYNLDDILPFINLF